MSTTLTPNPASPAHPEFEHLAVVYDGLDELSSLVVDDLSAAVERQEGVVVCVNADAWRQIRSELGAAAASVAYVPDDVRYAKPSEAMRIVHEFIQRCLRDGSEAVWSLGAIPLDGRRDDEWHRYEAAVNDVLAHLPFKGVCLFDASSCSDEHLDQARATHPELIDAAGRRVSDHYRRHQPPLEPIPLPRRPAELTMRPSTPADARHAVARLLRDGAGASLRTDAELVTSELVTNALTHGAPPVELTVWHRPGTSPAIIAVSDRGSGIDDPYFELRPPGGSIGGAGLWIVGQLADRVESRRNADGSHRVVARLVDPSRSGPAD